MSTAPPLLLLLTHPFLTFANVWGLRAVSRASRREVDGLLRELRHAKLEGMVVPHLQALTELLRRFEATTVDSLTLEVTVTTNGVDVDSAEDDELADADKRCSRVVMLPLGVLSAFPGLRHVRVVSRSERLPVSSSLWVEPWAITTTPTRAGLQLGLANLHEIADALPLVETIHAVHVETTPADKRVTDMWGPDATPLVLRRLREQCPRLRSVSLLSSPGPRMLGELRRRRRRRLQPGEQHLRKSNGNGSSARNVTPEVDECYSSSFLTEFAPTVAAWPSLETAIVCVSSRFAPFASARSALLHFRGMAVTTATATTTRTLRHHAQRHQGELEDLFALFAQEQNHVVHVVLRQFETRRDPTTVLAMQEGHEGKEACEMLPGMLSVVPTSSSSSSS